MLILPNSCFLHVPKTGGSWVKRAIVAAGIEAREYNINGNPHVALEYCPCPDRFKFAFVRYPLGMYRSYWQFKMTYGWDSMNRLDTDCGSDSFDVFVRGVLDRYPGFYSRGVEAFVGRAGNEIEFVGKYENLEDDLIRALDRAGEDFDERAITAVPPVNVSDKAAFPARCTAALENEILEAENAVIRRFGYG